MKVHELKLYKPYFGKVFTGQKTFEVRKDDRDFKEGDILILHEYNNAVNNYTGNFLKARITYKLMGGQFGIEEGHCILSIKIIKD